MRVRGGGHVETSCFAFWGVTLGTYRRVASLEPVPTKSSKPSSLLSGRQTQSPIKHPPNRKQKNNKTMVSCLCYMWVPHWAGRTGPGDACTGTSQHPQCLPSYRPPATSLTPSSSCLSDLALNFRPICPNIVTNRA